MPVQPIPDDFRGATPMLAIRGAAEAIEFYKRAFGAVEVMRLSDPQGKIAHAEIKIGGALVMLAEENLEYNRSPQTLGGTSVVVMIYVEEVDALFQRAVEAGANVIFPLRDQFYGDRSGRLEDPYGHMWILSKHIEDVSAKEMQRRFDALMQDEEQSRA